MTARGLAQCRRPWHRWVPDRSTLDALSVTPGFTDPAIVPLEVYDGKQFFKPRSDGGREKVAPGVEVEATSESEAQHRGRFLAPAGHPL
jgi:hypothetical protein